jgi:hypothetical protein
MRCMHGLFKLNMQWNAKIKRKLLIKSMRKTISPLLIILTMTHMIEFMSSVASDSVT